MNNRREQKPKDRSTISKQTKSRGTWDVNPVTKVKPGKKGKNAPYKRKPKHKEEY